MEQQIQEIKVISLSDVADVRRNIKKMESIINIHECNFQEQIKEYVKIRDELQKFAIEEKAKLEEKEKMLMDEIIKSAVFSEDKFLNAAKVKGDSYKDGRYRIIRHIKTERKLNQSAFKQKYPKAFNKIAEVGLTKADAEIGKNNVNQLCAVNEKYTFEFYDGQE
jgi:hypothetical protein